MSSLVNRIKVICDSLLNFVYEPSCPFELEETCSVGSFCSADGVTNKACSMCFNEFVDLELQPRLLDGCLSVISAAEYKLEARTIVHKLKWTSPQLGLPVSELLIHKLRFMKLDIESFDGIVPVPGIITPERDWVPSLELAKGMSKNLNIPLLTPLIKVMETKFFQHGKEKRSQLAEAAIQLSPDIEVTSRLRSLEKILLVDDLVASGSTLLRCFNLLKEINPSLQVTAVTFASVTSV
jgi:predicted amidophosphoribosyltransferase